MMGKIRERRMTVFQFSLMVSFLSYASSNNNVFEEKIEECTLECQNNGICKFGHAEFGLAAELEEDETPLPFIQSSQQNGMYCECLAGYTGLQCEVKFVVCGQDQHTCFNGADCEKSQDDSGGIFYHCECDAAQTDFTSAFAGHFCQHAATVMCATHTDGITPVRHSFCTNGGRCLHHVSEKQDHPGCDCQDGWEGPHCQFHSKKPKRPPSTGEHVGFVLVGISAGVCMFIGVVFSSYIVYIQRREYALERKIEMREFKDSPQRQQNQSHQLVDRHHPQQHPQHLGSIGDPFDPMNIRQLSSPSTNSHRRSLLLHQQRRSLDSLDSNSPMDDSYDQGASKRSQHRRHRSYDEDLDYTFPAGRFSEVDPPPLSDRLV